MTRFTRHTATGYTIVEVMIATGLSALMLAVLARGFVLMHTVGLTNEAHSRFTRQVTLLGKTLRAQLKQSDLSGLHQSADGKTLTFQQVSQSSSEGVKQWTADLLVLSYDSSRKTLEGKRVPLEDIGTPYLVTHPSPLDATMLSLAGSASESTLFEVEGVQECRLEVTRDPAHLAVDLRAEVRPFEKKIDALSFRTGVALSRAATP